MTTNTDLFELTSIDPETLDVFLFCNNSLNNLLLTDNADIELLTEIFLDYALTGVTLSIDSNFAYDLAKQ